MRLVKREQGCYRSLFGVAKRKPRKGISLLKIIREQPSEAWARLALEYKGRQEKVTSMFASKIEYCYAHMAPQPVKPISQADTEETKARKELERTKEELSSLIDESRSHIQTIRKQIKNH